FELQWMGIPFVVILPGRMLQDRFVCPGYHSKAGILDIFIEHALTLCRRFFLLEQRPNIPAYLLVRGLKVTLQLGLIEQQHVREQVSKQRVSHRHATFFSRLGPNAPARTRLRTTAGSLQSGGSAAAHSPSHSGLWADSCHSPW